MAVRDFSDEEIRLLKLVVQREQGRIHNDPSRPSQDRSYDENQDWLAPEVYIAKLSSQIEGRAAGTGSGGPDLPGVVESGVEIYRISHIDGSPILEVNRDFERDVHNIFDTSLQSGYQVIIRDKFGSWIGLTNGSLLRAKVTERVRNEGSGTGTEEFTGTGTGTGVDDPGTPVAIHRTSHPTGFNIKLFDCEGNTPGENLLCYADALTGVVYTDKAISFYIDQCGKRQAIDGEDFWSDAVTQEDILAGATGRVELFAGGPIVSARSDSSIASGTSCDVEFDSEAQIFKITAQQCPPAPPVS